MDEIEILTRQLIEVTPAPDPDRRARNIAALKKISSEAQETGVPARHRKDAAGRAGRAFGQRAGDTMKKMMKFLLMGGSGLAVAGVATVLFLPQVPTLLTDPSTSNQAAEGPTPIYADNRSMVEKLTSPLPSLSGQSKGAADNIAIAPDPRTTREIAPMGGAPEGPVMSAPMVARESMMAPSARAPGMLPMPAPDVMPPIMEQGRDRFPDAEINPVKVTAEDPVSTFSIDVDTASWSIARGFINRGQTPPSDAVRVEEMVNYFPYDYAGPEESTHPFAIHIGTYQTPWNAETEIVRIGLQGALPEIEGRPPLDLVFLVDTSGSMRSPNKLGLLRQSLKMMLPDLRPEDRVGIVTYAGSAGTALEMTPASERGKIISVLDRLAAGGSTAGAAGLRAAYDMISASGDEDRIGRVILATDGDFNVGMSSPEEMKDFIAEKRETGAYLSVLGFGSGNYNDALMQTLAQNGNGQAAYIDTLHEARKVLGDQLTGALFPIANDVKIQVEFNPAVVAEYRLIGYETRLLNREDFNNDRVDAGEVGAGHGVTALYEITPVGSPAVLNDPLRYGEALGAAPGKTDEIGFFKLRYKEPGARDSILVTRPIPVETAAPDSEAGFAMAIAGFAQILRDEPYTGEWTIGDAVDLARANIGEDPFGYRAEAVSLMRLVERVGDLR